MTRNEYIDALRLSHEAKQQLKSMGALRHLERCPTEELLIRELSHRGFGPAPRIIEAEREFAGLEVVVEGERLLITGISYCLNCGAEVRESSEGEPLVPWGTADSDTFYHLDREGRVYYSDNISAPSPFPEARDVFVFLERLTRCPPVLFPLVRTAEAAGDRLAKKLELKRVDIASDEFGAVYGSSELRVLEAVTWSESQRKPTTQTWVFGAPSHRQDVLRVVDEMGLKQVSNFGC